MAPDAKFYLNKEENSLLYTLSSKVIKEITNSLPKLIRELKAQLEKLVAEARHKGDYPLLTFSQGDVLPCRNAKYNYCPKTLIDRLGEY